MRFVTLAKENRVFKIGPFWAAVSASLTAFAGGEMAPPHDLGPPRQFCQLFILDGISRRNGLSGTNSPL